MKISIWLSLLLFILFGKLLSAQTFTYCPVTTGGTPSPTTLNVVHHSGIYGQSTYQLQSVKAIIYADFGEQYPYGKEIFEAVVALNIQVQDANGNTVAIPVGVGDFILSENTPEKAAIIELPIGTSTSATLYDVTITPSLNLTNNAAGLPLSADFRIKMCYVLEYKVDVVGQAPLILPTAPAPVSSSKRYQFTWNTNSVYHPYYELQVLRLYHTDDNIPQSQEQMETNIDWTEALSVLVPHQKLVSSTGSDYSYSLVLAEGTGYYAWRVRPIGTYYDGEVANNRNWGIWQQGALQQGDLISFTTKNDLNTATYNKQVLYYEDKDEQFNETEGKNRNYAYSRVFTEEGKIHESITYADGLSRARQSQSHLPSNPNNPTVISQTIYDRVGRPAISTLPVPTNTDIKSYREKFVQNANGKLYTSENFDTTGKITDPDVVKQAGTDFSYYSNDNIQNNYVPDAQGYPFSRSVFSNDGLGYVQEQSGVGPTHMLGSQTQGRGRTTRKNYTSDVSSEELLRIFGDEAPDPSTVTKEITVDPNGTKSIAYSNKMGKVIATCLSYNPDGNLLDSLKSEGDALSIYNLMETHTYEEGIGFIADKRLFFTETTDLTVEYTPATCGPYVICGQNITCDFLLHFYIYEVNAPQVNLAPATLQGISTQNICTASGGSLSATLNLPAGDYFIRKVLKPLDSGVGAIINTQIAALQVELNTYTSFLAALLGSMQQEEDWFEFSDCMTCVEDFVADSSLTAADLQVCLDNNQCGLDTALFDINELDSIPRDVISSITFDAVTGIQIDYDACGSNGLTIPTNINITSPCLSDTCSGAFPYEYAGACYAYPPYVEYFADVVAVSTIDAGIPLGPLLDSLFPGYNIDTTQIRHFVDGTNRTSLNDNAFNRMIWHMLNDQYFCGQLYWDAPLGQYMVVESDTTYAYDISMNKVQYQCKTLWKCWQAGVGIIETALAAYTDPDLAVTTPLDPADEVDDQQGGDPNVLDDHFDENLPFFLRLFLKLVGMSPTDRLRSDDATGVVPNLDNDDLKLDNLSYLFLQCAGFRYASMVDPRLLTNFGSLPTGTTAYTNAYTTYLNTQTIHTRGGTLGADPTLANNTLDIPRMGQYATTAVPTAISAYNNEIEEYFDTRQTTSLNSKDQPLSYNAQFAFKYYEYYNPATSYSNPIHDFFSTITGIPWFNNLSPSEQAQIALQAAAALLKTPSTLSYKAEYYACELQHSYAYTTPTPLDTPNCGVIVLPFGHDQWTCGKRYEFYDCIRYTRGIIPPASLEPSAAINCDSVRAAWDDTTGTTGPNQLSNNPIERGCQRACQERYSAFKNAIIAALETRCYVVGGCPGCANYIPMEDIDYMAQLLVDTCRTQCNLTTDIVTTTLCNLIDGTAITFCDFPNGTPCERYLMEQVKSWSFELDFPSVCPEDAADPYPDGHLQREIANNASVIQCEDPDRTSFNVDPDRTKKYSKVKQVDILLPPN